jgi:hypothetical protein
MGTGGAMGGTFEVVPGSLPTAPEPWENGWKDTVIAYPGQVTRVTMRFENPGQYVWHCHIVEHEDNEMMRPYRIGPLQPSQPLPTAMRRMRMTRADDPATDTNDSHSA